MSETVHYKGTLTLIEKLDNETIEEQCKRIMNNIELPSYYESYQEFLLDTYYKSMAILDDNLYDVTKIQLDYDDDIFIANINNNGDIEFEIRYYNGGCGFDEAILNAFKTLKDGN